MPAVITLASLFLVGAFAPASFMNHFTVFVLSCFVGYMVIWNVTASLHTPLMSVTNAVSSIIIIGAITQISTTDTISLVLASIAIFIAIKIAMLASTNDIVSVVDICVIAPMIIMLLTALVTDIRGVCNDAVTFQITIYPTKQDSTKTVK